MLYKILLFAIAISGATVFASGIYGNTSSFAESKFCKQNTCNLENRDDNFAATGTRYEYSIKLKGEFNSRQKNKVVILRNIDQLMEARFDISFDQERRSQSTAQAFSDFIFTLSGLKIPAVEFSTKCGSADYNDYNFKYFTLRNSKNFYIYCGLGKSGGRVKVSDEALPFASWDKNFLKNSGGLYANDSRVEIDSGMDTFSIQEINQNSNFKFLVDITPLNRIKADLQIGDRIRRVRLATAKPYKEPFGMYLKKDENFEDERIILPILQEGYAIFLQSNFKSFQTRTLKGIRYLEVGGQDWVTPTRDAYRYHFSGFTRDGKYHVHFIHTIEAKLLPKTEPNLDADSPGVGSRIYKAFAIAAKKVNEAKPNDFEPSLNKLDDFVTTLSVTSGK